MDYDEALDFLSELPSGDYRTDSVRPVSKSHDEVVAELENSRPNYSNVHVKVEYLEGKMYMHMAPTSRSLLETPAVGAHAVFDLDEGFDEFTDILEGRDWK